MTEKPAAENADALFVVPETSTSPPLAHAAVSGRADQVVPPPAASVALLVIHGMGQQVPFETIDQLARLLRRGTKPPPSVGTRMVRTGDRYLARARVRLDDGKVVRDVDIFEAYWAPLTAGKVSLMDVVLFLAGAAVDGLVRNKPMQFQRLIFGRWQYFKIRLGAFGLLALVAAVFLALVWISVVIVAVTASRSLLHAAPVWPSSTLVDSLTQDMLPFIVSAAVLAVLYLWAIWRERKRDQDSAGLAARRAPWLVNAIIWLSLVLTIFMTLLAAALIALHLAGAGAVLAWLQEPPIVGPVLTWLWGRQFTAWEVGALWIVVMGLNLYVRNVLVDYLGDVTAYIAAHTVSKFEEIRTAIQLVAKDAAQAILGMKDGTTPKPKYGRVIMVGHSLGSVIAYDTTNALLLDEDLGINADLEAKRRITHLITFGSPLDKTAFLFREQQSRNSQVREALATNVQPLILEDRFRRGLRWTNLWARADLISGSLEYYDEDQYNAQHNPRQTSPRVENLSDPHSTIPLLAHIMYWQSPLLLKVLRDATR